MTGSFATIWTKVQCYECKCTNWFTGFPFNRAETDFAWVRSGDEHWVQCDINKTDWGKRPGNDGFINGTPGANTGGFGYRMVTMRDLREMKDGCAKQAEESCKKS
jgi:hypothetical protein